MSSFEFPDSEQLAHGLAVALQAVEARGMVTILDRKPNPYNSTFPTEIVTCRDSLYGGVLKLFVKYGFGRVDSVFGHRGDLSYEAKVYRDILQPLSTTAPAFYGAYRDRVTGIQWLVLEYLAGGHRASWTRDPRAMIRSARWAGSFHAMNEARILNPRFRFLHKYNRDYYMGWSRRTRQFFENHSGKLKTRFPWVAPLCDTFETLLPNLLRAGLTIIHGECFGSNIVYQNGITRPIDWQSAAIAPGEIDLAALTLAWPKKFVERLESTYEEARWPTGAPDHFTESLLAARVYMSLRWLGDTKLMTQWFRPRLRFVVPKDPRKILAELHAISKNLEVA